MKQVTAERVADRGSEPSGWRLAGLRLYYGMILVGAICLLYLLAYAQLYEPLLHPVGSFPWISLIVLSILALLTEIFTIQVSPGMNVSAGFLASFLAIPVIGPLSSAAVAVIGQLSALRSRGWRDVLSLSAMLVVVSGSTSLLYWVSLAPMGGFGRASPIAVVAVGLAAGVFHQGLNFALVVPVMWLGRSYGPKQYWQMGVRPILKFDLFFLGVTVGLISIYRQFLPKTGGAADPESTLIVVLCLVPVAALVWALRQWSEQRSLAETNAGLARRNERLALQAVASQVRALDLKDNYTARHSASVAQWSRDIAEAMGLSESEQNLCHLAGVLHDVGKIGVPDDVLKSSERLDAEKWALIERHCENGYEVLRTIDQFEDLAKVVLHHHERYDGSGYPMGLAGEEIPLISRIITVADSYSAMTSHRPYGPPLSTDVATAELEFKKGSQFDPQVVDTFLAVLAQHDEAYQRGIDVDFETEVHRIRYLNDLPVELSEAQLPDKPPGDALRSEAGSGSLRVEEG